MTAIRANLFFFFFFFDSPRIIVLHFFFFFFFFLILLESLRLHMKYEIWVLIGPAVTDEANKQWTIGQQILPIL